MSVDRRATFTPSRHVAMTPQVMWRAMERNWVTTAKATASEESTFQTERASTARKWYTPIDPGDDGIAAPRFVVTTTRTAAAAGAPTLKASSNTMTPTINAAH